MLAAPWNHLESVCGLSVCVSVYVTHQDQTPTLGAIPLVLFISLDLAY